MIIIMIICINHSLIEISGYSSARSATINEIENKLRIIFPFLSILIRNHPTNTIFIKFTIS